MTMMKAEVVKIFTDLEEYLDFCRFEMREYNPAHLYDKSSNNYRAFLAYRSGNWKPRRNNNRNNNNNRRYDNR